MVATILITIGSFPLYFLSNAVLTSWLIFVFTVIQALGFIICQKWAIDLTLDQMKDPTTEPTVASLYTLTQSIFNGVLMWVYLYFSAKDGTYSKIFMALLPIGCAFM